MIRDGDGGLEGLMARWDFVPWFHKGPLEAKKRSGINARIEACATSGAYRDGSATFEELGRNPST